MCLKTRCRKKVQNVEEVPIEFALLDLPELVIEDILRLLPAPALARMAGVSSELRSRCGRDYLWENLLLQKWGKLVGPNEFSAWGNCLASTKGMVGKNSLSRSDVCKLVLACIWPFSCLQAKEESKSTRGSLTCFPLMAFYGALESGEFWFPAQVFNRESGHVGFMLSCYDADICYEHTRNAFRARYPQHGTQTVVVEDDIPWARVRASPVITSPYELHETGDLFPGDHVEVQWKRSSEFPYGWWYGLVGHADNCNSRRGADCFCHLEDMVWLEFNQYTHGSRWRRAAIKRYKVSEEGNELEGFYGGIRKLGSQEEISMWMQLWPKECLE